MDSNEPAIVLQEGNNLSNSDLCRFVSIASWKMWCEKCGLQKPVFFVPTMGALHEGHAALIKAARNVGGPGVEVVVSIYVNPTQFNDAADFKAYPKTSEADVALALAAGADRVVFPETQELYPQGIPTEVDPVNYGSLTSLWEAHYRPGHFDGVVAVVRSLFAQFRPKQAFFGEKDWQQLAVINRLAQLEFSDLKVVPVATVRAPNGLALSSRNGRLSAAQRNQSKVLFAALMSVVDSGGSRGAISQAISSVESVGMRVEYMAVVDEESLVEPWSRKGPGRVLAAAWMNGVRLIDNVGIQP